MTQAAPSPLSEGARALIQEQLLYRAWLEPSSVPLLTWDSQSHKCLHHQNQSSTHTTSFPNATSFPPWGKGEGRAGISLFNTGTIKFIELSYLHSKVKCHHFNLKPVSPTGVPVTRGFRISLSIPITEKSPSFWHIPRTTLPTWNISTASMSKHQKAD